MSGDAFHVCFRKSRDAKSSNVLWTNDVAHALVREIKITQGDQMLVKYTGEFLRKN